MIRTAFLYGFLSVFSFGGTAEAALVSVDFSQVGFTGSGTLSGTFTGDLSIAGRMDYDALNTFHATYTSDGGTTIYNWDYDDIDRLDYYSSGPIQWIDLRAYNSSLAELQMHPAGFTTVFGPTTQDGSNHSVYIASSPVPAPPVSVLLMLGMVTLIAARKKSLV